MLVALASAAREVGGEPVGPSSWHCHWATVSPRQRSRVRAASPAPRADSCALAVLSSVNFQWRDWHGPM